MDEFEREWAIFSTNVERAARYFYQIKEIHNLLSAEIDAAKSEHKPDIGHFPIYNALSKNAQFWNDHEHKTIYSIIIILGCIFDSGDSHRIERLTTLANSCNVFHIENIKRRVNERLSSTPQIAESYLVNINVYDNDIYISNADIKKIRQYIQETRKAYHPLKSYRNKMIAHQDILPKEDRNRIRESVEYKLVEEIIERLIKIDNVFFNMYHNAISPDFSFHDQRIKRQAAEDVRNLIHQLQK